MTEKLKPCPDTDKQGWGGALDAEKAVIFTPDKSQYTIQIHHIDGVLRFLERARSIIGKSESCQEKSNKTAIPDWIELPEGWEDQDGIYTEFLRKHRIRGDLEALFFSPSCPQDIRVSSCLAFNGPWKKSKATHIAKWTPPKGPME